MLFELEEPFSSIWRKGYLVDDGSGRKRVVLYNSENDISGMTYARYLMCVKLKTILPTELEVDHVNDDKSDDSIDNLQILTKQQNILKQKINYVLNEQVCYGYHCAYCETAFILTESEVNKRKNQSKTNLVFCSKECSMQLTSMNSKISQEQIDKIKELRQKGYSSYKISDELNLSRNTVMKYW